MKNKLKFLFFVVLALVALAIIFIYKPQRDIASEVAFANLGSQTLISDFEKNDKKSTQKFLNKTLIIKGKITEISDNLIVLDDVISCVFNIKPMAHKIGDIVVIKGKLTGFENDILTEIKIQECSIIK